MEQLNEVLKVLYNGIYDIAMWIFAIRMVADVLKAGTNSDIEATIKTLINGGVSYGSLYAIVEVLEGVKHAFAK